jgi:hypothetical protein
MIFAMTPGYAHGRSVGSAARLLGEVHGACDRLFFEFRVDG